MLGTVGTCTYLSCLGVWLSLASRVRKPTSQLGATNRWLLLTQCYYCYHCYSLPCETPKKHLGALRRAPSMRCV
ncbi:hypothetical protein F4811DRAFT_507967 [Daldinia bambusicola]|nr:hypothetical protein F4811DRAFT_507967 [Daldinia bambusicola]